MQSPIKFLLNYRLNQQQIEKTNVGQLKKYKINKLLLEVFGPTAGTRPLFQKGVAPQALIHWKQDFQTGSEKFVFF
jgi:hypothetical protein